MSGIKSRLLQWGVGRAERGQGLAESGCCAVVLLESADQLGELLQTGLVGPGSTVFLPEDHATTTGTTAVVGSAPHEPKTEAQLVRYAGSAGEVGDELSLSDEFFLQIQAYGISEFMSVVGPTLVRVADESDFAAYLRDADKARADGVFPDFMMNPVVQLADVSALGAGPDGDGPAVRLAVAADGTLSTSTGGAPLGRLALDGMQQLSDTWRARNAGSDAPCAVSLGGVLEESARARELRLRPWLARYLAAANALRSTTARGIPGVRVSGFGGTLAAGLDDVPPVEDGQAPLVLWAPECAFVYDPKGHRTFQMNHRTATVLDVLITSGGVAAGREYLAEDQLREGEMLLAQAGLELPARSVMAMSR